MRAECGLCKGREGGAPNERELQGAPGEGGNRGEFGDEGELRS